MRMHAPLQSAISDDHVQVGRAASASSVVLSGVTRYPSGSATEGTGTGSPFTSIVTWPFPNVTSKAAGSKRPLLVTCREGHPLDHGPAVVVDKAYPDRSGRGESQRDVPGRLGRRLRGRRLGARCGCGAVRLGLRRGLARLVSTLCQAEHDQERENRNDEDRPDQAPARPRTNRGRQPGAAGRPLARKLAHLRRVRVRGLPSVKLCVLVGKGGPVETDVVAIGAQEASSVGGAR